MTSDTGNIINISKSKMTASTKTMPTVSLIDLQNGSLRNMLSDIKLIDLPMQQAATNCFHLTFRYMEKEQELYLLRL